MRMRACVRKMLSVRMRACVLVRVSAVSLMREGDGGADGEKSTTRSQGARGGQGRRERVRRREEALAEVSTREERRRLGHRAGQGKGRDEGYGNVGRQHKEGA
jgi:hypothetical protein